jgi:hypothetical protein
MTETTGPTTETDEAPTGDYDALAAALAGQKPDADTEVTDEPAESDDDDDGNPNREAAKWRTKLRDTEAQRDAVATQLANMQRAAVDTQITALGIKPAAVYAVAKVEDLIGEDGVPDAKKVEAAATAAKDQLGLAVIKPPPKRLQSGAAGPQPKSDSWLQAFAPRDK